MASVYDVLLSVGRSAQPKFPVLAAAETDADYLARLAQAVSSVSKEAFDAMPLEAQNWFDRAADALNGGSEIPLPDGYDRAAASQAAAAPARAALGRPVTSAKPVRAKKEKPPKPVKPAKVVLGREIRKTILAIYPQEIAVADLITRLESGGFNVGARSTVSAYRNDTMTTLEMAIAAGWRPPQQAAAE